jgi:hypothetical protein
VTGSRFKNSKKIDCIENHKIYYNISGNHQTAFKVLVRGTLKNEIFF